MNKASKIIEQDHSHEHHHHDGECCDHDHTQTIVHTHEKVGRNDPCICGSGKKYKKCCLRH